MSDYNMRRNRKPRRRFNLQFAGVSESPVGGSLSGAQNRPINISKLRNRKPRGRFGLQFSGISETAAGGLQPGAQNRLVTIRVAIGNHEDVSGCNVLEFPREPWGVPTWRPKPSDHNKRRNRKPRGRFGLQCSGISESAVGASPTWRPQPSDYNKHRHRKPRGRFRLQCSGTSESAAGGSPTWSPKPSDCNERHSGKPRGRFRVIPVVISVVISAVIPW